MREAFWIAQIEELKRQQNAIAYHMQLGFSGNALYEATMKAILIQKGLFTEEEFAAALGEQIRVINEKDAAQAKAEAEKAEADAKTLVTPTPAEVVKVEETKAE